MKDIFLRIVQESRDTLDSMYLIIMVVAIPTVGLGKEQMTTPLWKSINQSVVSRPNECQICQKAEKAFERRRTVKVHPLYSWYLPAR